MLNTRCAAEREDTEHTLIIRRRGRRRDPRDLQMLEDEIVVSMHVISSQTTYRTRS